MNFTTDLPKRRPYVTYIVASAVKCEKFFPNSRNEGPSYRMHAVILNKSGSQSQSYKLKYRGLTHSDGQESHSANSINSTNSTNPSLSSYADKADGNNMKTENHHIPFIKEKMNKTQEKSYILCHIRKIDHNYKITKKRRSNRDSADLYDEFIPTLRDSTTINKIYAGPFKREEPYMLSNSFPKPLPIQPSKQQLQHLIQQSSPDKHQENGKSPFTSCLVEKPKSINMFHLGGVSVNTSMKSVLDNKDIIPIQKKIENSSHLMNLDDTKTTKSKKISDIVINENDTGIINIIKGTTFMSIIESNIAMAESLLSQCTKIDDESLHFNKSNILSTSELLVSQFDLDVLLTEELKRYENDNYDYYKIFNVILAHKYQ